MCTTRLALRPRPLRRSRLQSGPPRYRRQWVVDRMNLLTQAFSIEVASYAILSNHYHLVLRVDERSAALWTWQKVVEQWHLLYSGNMLSQRFMQGEKLTAAKQRVRQRFAELRRARLSSISWFMSALNAHIARRSNIEDEVTDGWPPRILGSAVQIPSAARRASHPGLSGLSERRPVALNPIRANIASTPETSDYTSIKQRIKAAASGSIPHSLTRFQGSEKKDQQDGIPCALQDYIELVEEPGRVGRPDHPTGQTRSY